MCVCVCVLHLMCSSPTAHRKRSEVLTHRPALKHQTNLDFIFEVCSFILLLRCGIHFNNVKLFFNAVVTSTPLQNVRLHLKVLTLLPEIQLRSSLQQISFWSNGGSRSSKRVHQLAGPLAFTCPLAVHKHITLSQSPILTRDWLQLRLISVDIRILGYFVSICIRRYNVFYIPSRC